MDAWFEQPILGLPLRMIFTRSWHVINTFIFFLGLMLFGISQLFEADWLETVSFIAMGYPMVCFILLPILAWLFMILEKIFEQTQTH